jgi:regulator of cell morphogenesis and NO signaling
MSQLADVSVFAGQTVGRIAATLPGAAGIFQDHGVDFCCGGDQTLAAAAAKRALDVDTLISELAAANPAGEATGFADDVPSAQLIEHIKTRYHAVHLRELRWLIRLAGKVEAAHRHSAVVPAGLVDVLARLRAEMTLHQKREEVVLFPMMLAGGGPMIAAAIATMRAEHEDHGASLSAIDRLTHGRTAPDDACATWRALCTGLTKFHNDLVMHVHLENNILFPRFANTSAADARA